MEDFLLLWPPGREFLLEFGEMRERLNVRSPVETKNRLLL